MALAHFCRQHPAVQLEITIALGPDIRHAFDAGQLDEGDKKFPVRREKRGNFSENLGDGRRENSQ